MNVWSSKLMERRKALAEQALSAVVGDEDLILFFSGEPLQKPGGLDQTYPFLPHPDYYWLTGYRRPFGITAFSKGLGFVDFVKPVSQVERIWEGSQEELKGRDVDEFETLVDRNLHRRIFLMGQVPPRFQSWSRENSLESQLVVQEAFNRVRRPKDPTEIQLVRSLAQMARAGYDRLKQVIRPGISEREIQIEYEATVLKAGAEKMPYDTIVGAGTNSAVLHALPTQRQVAEGDLVLVDAGADFQDYCVDVTRVFPATGEFSGKQKIIFDLVAAAQKAAIGKCQIGIEWHDVHQTAARILAEGLRDLGLLVGSTEELLANGAIALFFPHGVGHMVGLRVRDVGADVTRAPRTCCGVRVRVDFPLGENFLMTVEPGLYFVPSLLQKQEIRQKFTGSVRWSEVDKWMDFGGIRLEDDILVTAQGPENLTSLIG